MSKKKQFTKEQLIRHYKERADLINALLENDRRYTLEEVDAAIKKFMKGTVK